MLGGMHDVLGDVFDLLLSERGHDIDDVVTGEDGVTRRRIVKKVGAEVDIGIGGVPSVPLELAAYGAD